VSAEASLVIVFRCLLLLILLAPAASAEPAASDSVGTILGRLVSGPDSSPIADMNVIAIGTRRGTQTDDEGRFRLTQVPVGPQTLRLLGLGRYTIVAS
jgi:hypothetical protein